MAAPGCSHPSGLAPGASQFRSVNLSTSTTGKVLSILNPEQVPVYVRDAVIEVVQKSAAACVLDIGVQTSDATSDNLIDGISVATAPAHTLYDNITDHGTNGTTRQYLDVGDYITVYVASGDANGLQANFSFGLQLISGGQSPFP